MSVDNNLGKYYRWFIPKALSVKEPMYPSHISVVRNEVLPNYEKWGKYQGLKVAFLYEPYIYNDETYYWLNAYSPVLEQVREELGLPMVSDITMSPDKKHKFHITIGNVKHLNERRY